MATVKMAIAAALLALGVPAVAGTFDVAPPKTEPPGSARSEEKPAPPKIQITVPGAATEAQAKARLSKDTHLARCVIKPVMTDEEIETCKTAYREP